MNAKTILLLISLVNLSSLHADTTKPIAQTLFESLYTGASRSAQKLKDGLCNLDPINAGIALLATLATNHAANHMVYKKERTSLKQAEQASLIAVTKVAQTAIRIAGAERAARTAQRAQKDTEEEIEEDTEEEIEEDTEEDIEEDIEEQLDAAQRELTNTTTKLRTAQAAATPNLLKELSTKTFSFAAWLNIYNTMQRQAGKKTIEMPLFSYFDFSACLANKTFSMSLNLADSWDYLCSFF